MSATDHFLGGGLIMLCRLALVLLVAPLAAFAHDASDHALSVVTNLDVVE
jgi:hypothetical protein